MSSKKSQTLNADELLEELYQLIDFAKEDGDISYKFIMAMIDHLQTTGRVNGIWTNAGKAIGYNRKRARRLYKNLRQRAALKGKFVDKGIHQPPGFKIYSMTTMYNEETGKTKFRWVKAKPEHELLEQVFTDWVEELTEGIKDAAGTIPAPKITDEDLLSVYPLGDPHFGMLALKEETGDDFNIEIACNNTKKAIKHLVESGPDSETALFISLGDLFHADNNIPVTPRGKHHLDTDTTFHNVMVKSLETMTYCIDLLRKKHERVIVWMVMGNHDPHASFAISLALAAFYNNEPRVIVDTAATNYKFFNFGKVLIGATHGNDVSLKNLPLLMAAKMPNEWGKTEYRYWYCGHVHHKKVIEEGGVIVETFRTLAPKDGWTDRRGYFSGRDSQLIVHHKNYGEIERYTSSLQRILCDSLKNCNKE